MWINVYLSRKETQIRKTTAGSHSTMHSLQLYEETFMLLYSPSALLYYCRAAGVILPTFFFSALHPFLQTLSLFLVSQTFPASRLLGNGHLNDVSKARRHVRRWCQVTHTHTASYKEVEYFKCPYCFGIKDRRDILSCLSFFVILTPSFTPHITILITFLLFTSVRPHHCVLLSGFAHVSVWQNPISAAENATRPP